MGETESIISVLRCLMLIKYLFNILKPAGHVMPQQFNHLKPTGYVMLQQFNHLKPTGCVVHKQFNH